MAKTIRQRRGSTFYFSKDTFDGVSKAVLLDAVAVAVSAEAAEQVIGIIDEKHGVGDGVFLYKLRKEFSRNSDCVGRKQPTMEDSVRGWIHSSVQPILLIVDSDRFLIDRNAIRFTTTSWL